LRVLREGAGNQKSVNESDSQKSRNGCCGEDFIQTHHISFVANCSEQSK
jgi:hypothetical protein